jgi:hypothetical protein
MECLSGLVVCTVPVVQCVNMLGVDTYTLTTMLGKVVRLTTRSQTRCCFLVLRSVKTDRNKQLGVLASAEGLCLLLCCLYRCEFPLVSSLSSTISSVHHIMV